MLVFGENSGKAARFHFLCVSLVYLPILPRCSIYGIFAYIWLTCRQIFHTWSIWAIYCSIKIKHSCRYPCHRFMDASWDQQKYHGQEGHHETIFWAIHGFLERIRRNEPSSFHPNQVSDSWSRYSTKYIKMCEKHPQEIAQR